MSGHLHHSTSPNTYVFGFVEIIKMCIVYVLKSLKDSKRYYIGITNDVERRLKEHNDGESGYSKKYAPWDLETYVVFKNRMLAEKFEKYLKAGSGQAFLKRRLI